MGSETKKTQQRDDTAAIVAGIHGVTSNYVRKVVKGKRFNDQILETYNKLKDGKNNLIEAVKKAIPL